MTVGEGGRTSAYLISPAEAKCTTNAKRKQRENFSRLNMEFEILANCNLQNVCLVLARLDGLHLLSRKSRAGETFCLQKYFLSTPAWELNWES